MSELSLSRARNPDLQTSELRIEDVPKRLLDMLDACSLDADGRSGRKALVISILEAWAQKEARKHILISRIVGDNRTISDLAGMDAE
jgi:hypothetical protein